MVQQKMIYRIIGTGLLALFFLFSCKKLAKEEIGIQINAVVPSDGTPIPGVKYRVVEEKSRNGIFATNEETGWVTEGKTDQNGKANIIFKPKKNSKYSYMIYFDYSEVVLPAGAWSFINPPSYRNVTKEFMSVHNTYEIRALPKTGMHYKVENVNCYDENDKMRFKSYNYDESPNWSFDINFPWGNYFTGSCGLKVEDINNNVIGGHQVYLIEVTRNGQTTQYVDTFNLLPNTMNEVFIQY